METIEAHPIKELIERVLVEDGARSVLPDDARQFLEAAIDEIAKNGSPEIMLVAQTVFSMADWLEETCSFDAAISLCALMSRESVLTSMQMINERLKNKVGAVEHGTPGDDFASFASKETHRRAAHVEASAPNDAVKLGSLAYPKRL